MIGQAQCGDTLVLKAGTYNRSVAMSGAAVFDINSSTAPSAVNCLASRVTVTADTEADPPLFDGENDSSYISVKIFGVKGWTIEKFNAKRGWGNIQVGNGGTITDTSGIIISRAVAWDCVPAVNCQSVLVWQTTNTTIEDVGSFGISQQTFEDFGTNTGCIFRRIWSRNEGGNSAGGVGATPQFGYGIGSCLVENAILLVGSNRGDLAYAANNILRDNSPSPYTRFLGNIWYVKSGEPALGSYVESEAASPGNGVGIVAYDLGCSGYTIQDTAIWHTNNTARTRAFSFKATAGSGCDENGTAVGPRTLTRVTVAYNSGLTQSNFSDITPTNYIQSSTVGGTGFDYQGASNTAKLCFRYVDGTYTSTKLWPWPMDDRIKAAIELNSGNGSVALSGSAGTGYAANTVTSEIVSLFGSIPSACNSGSAFTPSFPVASDFPSIAVRDTFDRANASTLGANWTSLLADVFSIESNTAAAPAAAFARSVYSAQLLEASHEVYATWTATPPCCGEATALSFAGTDLTVNNQYRLYLNRQSGANSTVIVYKVDSGGNFTTVISAVDLGIDFDANEGLGVRVSGTTIKAYWKYTDGIWYEIGSAVDATVPTSGGVYGGIAGASTARINDFGAGPNQGAPVIPPSPPPSSGAGRFGTTFPGVR